MATTCVTCGRAHDEWPPGFGFARPDAVFAMAAKARRKRVLEHDEFCCLDGERHWVHAVLELPVVGIDAPWAMDVWVEVDGASFRRHLDALAGKPGAGATFAGHLANAIDGFPDALGTPVEGRYATAGERPSLRVRGVESTLGRAQHDGLRDDALHAALAALGYED